MIGLPAGTRIWIVAGVTDLRRGFVGLAGMVQTTLEGNPFLCGGPRYVAPTERAREGSSPNHIRPTHILRRSFRL
jgi:transposase